MSCPQQTTPTPPRIFYPTNQKRVILQALANYYCLAVKDLVALVYPQPNPTHEASMRRTLLLLHRQGFVNRISYRPDDYHGHGTLPLACGLTRAGVLWAHEHCPWTDPKEFIRDH